MFIRSERTSKKLANCLTLVAFALIYSDIELNSWHPDNMHKITDDNFKLIFVNENLVSLGFGFHLRLFPRGVIIEKSALV